MFPSSNMVINTSTIEINQQPVSYPHHDQPSFFIHRPNFHNDLSSTPNPNSNSKQENPPLLYCFDFPSPFGNDDVLVLPQQQHHDLQSLEHSQVPGSLMREAAAAADGHQHQHQQSSTTTSTTTNTLIKMVDWESNKLNHDKNIDEGEQHQIPMRSSRRSCKRDRHSKIKTARGMRDRRMRLSLEIARRFFGLQDVLGFDKASKTVEWLLKQAETEIKKLLKLQAAGTTRDGLEILNYYHNSKSTSSATSESCEMVSGIDEVATNIIDVKETKRNNKRKRSAFHHPLAKALREKARARARERTREKMRRRERSSSLVVVDDHDHEDQSKQHQQQPPCDQLSRLSSWSTSPPFEAGEESANNNNINHDPIPNSLVLVPQAQLLQAEVLEQPISSSQLAAAGGTSTSTSTAATAHQDLHLVDHNGHDANLVIMGRYWSPSPSFNSLQQSSCTGISQEQHHLFADIQLFGKPWEAYNTHNPF